MTVEDLPESVLRMLDAAKDRGIDVEVVARPAADSLVEAAAILRVEPADIAKTIVVKRGAGDHLFAIVPGDRVIAWPKLRALLGVNRLSMPDAATAKEVTGYERGTITPIGADGGLPVVVDAGLVGRRVAMGAGTHGFSAFVDVDALVSGFDAVVSDIT